MCKNKGDGELSDCVAHTKICKRVSSLWTQYLYPKDNMDEWHQLECHVGRCEACGVKVVKFCPLELSTHRVALLQLKCFQCV